jgi:hypothetical protein
LYNSFDHPETGDDFFGLPFLSSEIDVFKDYTDHSCRNKDRKQEKNRGFQLKSDKQMTNVGKRQNTNHA